MSCGCDYVACLSLWCSGGKKGNISNFLYPSNRKACLVLRHSRETRLCTALGWMTVRAAAAARETLQVSVGGKCSHYSASDGLRLWEAGLGQLVHISRLSGENIDGAHMRIRASASWAINMEAALSDELHLSCTSRAPSLQLYTNWMCNCMKKKKKDTLCKLLLSKVHCAHSITNSSVIPVQTYFIWPFFLLSRPITNDSLWTINLLHVGIFFRLEQLAALRVWVY